MIVSHKHKFIFIKTAKTAGTSIEIALSKICGPKDIITPISPDDEKYRKNLGFRTKQNFYIPISKYSKKDILFALYRRKRLKFYNHMGAEQIRRYIDDKHWNSYFKFAFERNPYDRLVSAYWFFGGDKRFSSIENFTKSVMAAKLSIWGFESYTQNSKVVVDEVYKYEELNEAMIDISKKIGLKHPLELPKKKARGNFRKDKRHYRNILLETEKKWVEKVCAREIAFWGYRY